MLLDRGVYTWFASDKIGAARFLQFLAPFTAFILNLNAQHATANYTHLTTLRYPSVTSRGGAGTFQTIMVPRSFEQRIYITMARTGHSLAFASRGVCAAMATRLGCLSRFCALYSFTGALFTVSNKIFAMFLLSYMIYVGTPLWTIVAIMRHCKTYDYVEFECATVITIGHSNAPNFEKSACSTFCHLSTNSTWQ
jgi:hypothetical protein